MATKLTWLSHIQAPPKTALSKGQRAFIKKLLSVEDSKIPSNKNAFISFVRSKHSNKNEKFVGDIFDLLNKTYRERISEAKSSNFEINDSAAGNVQNDSLTNGISKDKKKKKKKNKNNINISNEHSIVDESGSHLNGSKDSLEGSNQSGSLTNNISKEKRKRKRRKNKNNKVDNENSTNKSGSQPNIVKDNTVKGVQTTQKKKKLNVETTTVDKKKKNKQNDQMQIENQSASISKTNKLKRKLDVPPTNGSTEAIKKKKSEENLQPENQPAKKKRNRRKKKNKPNTVLNESTNSNKDNGNSEASQSEVKKLKKKKSKIELLDSFILEANLKKKRHNEEKAANESVKKKKKKTKLVSNL